MSVDNKERLTKLKQRKHQLEQEYEKKLEIEKATRSKLMELESEFEYAKNNRLLHAMNPAKIKKSPEIRGTVYWYVCFIH